MKKKLKSEISIAIDPVYLRGVIKNFGCYAKNASNPKNTVAKGLKEFHTYHSSSISIICCIIRQLSWKQHYSLFNYTQVGFWLVQ